MIKIKKDVTYKTNSYYPKPWTLTEEPFRAFRGEGQSYKAFLAIHQSVKDPLNDPTKLIKTKAKGTLLVVPARIPEEDELIALIMTRSGFRGWFSKIETHNVEVVRYWSSTKHCIQVIHHVTRFKDRDGWIAYHYGRRCGRGKVDVFRWEKDVPDEYTEDEWHALAAMTAPYEDNCV